MEKPSASGQPNKIFKNCNTFNERFEQILLTEISPTIWLSVWRCKVLNFSIYVDIRQKRERRADGEKTHIPTRNGVFLRRPEFDELKEVYEAWCNGSKDPKVPYEISADGRKVIFSMDGERFKIFLDNCGKKSAILLSANEMAKTASYSLAENLASIVAEFNWV